MAVALVQKTAQQIFSGVSTTSRTITGVTSGNLVVCLITAASQPNPTNPPAIATPSGWTVAENPLGPGPSTDAYRPVNAIFYKANAASGSHTADFSGASALPIDSYGAITLFEVSGCDTSSPLDTHNTTTSTSAAGSGSTPSVTNTVADAIAFAIGHPDSQSVSNLSFPPSSGYTDSDHSTNNSTDAAYDFGYKILSATGSQSASWTWTGTSHFSGTIAIFKAAAGGGPVSAALTGVAGTGGVGTVAPSSSKALAGNAGTGSVGTVSPALSKALTGNAGTSAVGSVSPSVTIALTGNQATGAVGSVSAGSDATAALTGVAGTGSVGSVAPAVSIAPSGVAGTGGVGTVAPSTSKGLTGNAGTGSVGSVSPAASVGLSGGSGAGAVGSVGPAVTVGLSGVSATGAVGTVTAVTGGVIQALTGVAGTGQAGSVGIDVVIGLTGVSGTGLVGDISLPSPGGGRDDAKTKIRRRVNELNKKILQAEAEEAQEITQIAVTKAKSAPKSAPTQGFDEDEEEALMLLL